MNKPKNIPLHYTSKGTPIYRDTTGLPFLNGGSLVDKTNHGKLLPSVYASALGNYYSNGGQFSSAYSLPEDSFKQGGDNLHNSIYASSLAQYPALYKYGGSFDTPRQQMYMPLDNIERYGGSILSMSNTPQLEGEGKDLTYPDGAYVYGSGGIVKTSHLFASGGFTDPPQKVKDSEFIKMFNKGVYSLAPLGVGMTLANSKDKKEFKKGGTIRTVKSSQLL